MIRFFDTDIDETDEINAVPEICEAIITALRRCKAYEQEKCKADRPRLISMSELHEKYEHEPYKTLMILYKAFQNEFYKLPYSILYKVEAGMMAGMDITEDQDDAFDIGNGDCISIRDYDGLAKYYDIPLDTDEGGNVQSLIEYVCSKRDLDIYLSAYLRASGQYQ